MLTFLLDTNILLRIINKSDAQHLVASESVKRARDLGAALYLTPQNFVEFRHVATRPTEANGFGWSSLECDEIATTIEKQFAILPETEAIFEHWKQLVQLTGSRGRTVHDARLAAVAVTYGIDKILTFNSTDFNRFAPFGVSPIAPATL